MDAYLGKKYILDTTENLDEYLIFMGRNESQRQMAKTMKLEFTLTSNGDGTYKFTESIPVVAANVENTFTPGVEFDEMKLDGNTVKSTITIEGNVLTQITKDGGKTIKNVKEFYPDKMNVATTGAGIDKTVKWYYVLAK